MNIVVIVFLNPRNRDTLGNLKRVIALRLTLTDPVFTDESQPPSVRYDDRIAGVEVVDNVNSLSGGDVSHQFCIGCGAPLNERECAICTPSDGHAGGRYEGAMVAPWKAVAFLRNLGYVVEGYEKAAAFERAHLETRMKGSVGFQSRSDSITEG